MRRLLLISALVLWGISATFARQYRVEDIPNVQRADALRYTSNPDGVLSEASVAAIDRACDTLRRRGVAEVAVVAVRDIRGGDVFDFGHRLFSAWGVGDDERDNGLGILLVVERGEIRFFTGDGLEGVLPDALCKRIQQRYMVEPFRRGDFDEGMVEGMRAVAQTLSGEEVAAAEEENPMVFVAVFGGMLLFAMALVALAFLYEWQRRKCPHCGKHKMRVAQSLTLRNTKTYTLVQQTLVCGHCGHSVQRNVKHEKAAVIVMGGGSGRGGGFGGGGFGGGFGGGHFGGGGAGSRF